jgi:hypothetical protein
MRSLAIALRAIAGYTRQRMSSRHGEFSVELTAESRRTLGKLRNLNALPEIRRSLRLATSDVAPAVKQAARGLPSKRAYKADGLRARLARAVTRRVSASRNSISVYVTLANRPNTPANGVEGTVKGRHPLFGDRGHWYPIEPTPFFYDTLRRLEANVSRRVSEALREIERKL